jgi:hypothetical protein
MEALDGSHNKDCKKQVVTASALVHALSFLPIDALLSLRLVSRGCHIMVGHEMRSAERCRRNETTMQSLEWAAWERTMGVHAVGVRAVGCLRSMHIHIHESTYTNVRDQQHNHRRPSAMEIPGMPTQDPLDELSVEWGGVYPTASLSHSQSLVVEWRRRTVWPFSLDDGSHGRWYLGVATAHHHPNDAVSVQSCVVSLTLVVYSHCGSTFCLAMSLLFNGEALRDVYWHFRINPEDVAILLRRPTTSANPSGQAGNESIVSSHPLLFGHWFTHLPKTGKRSGDGDGSALDLVSSEEAHSDQDPKKLPLDELSPFSLLVSAPSVSSAENPCSAQSVTQLLSLCTHATSDRSETEFADFIGRVYLRPISSVVEQYKGNVYTIREEFAEMVTPKGVWTYPTGFAFAQLIDAQRMWRLRRDRMMQSIQRSIKKGSCDMFLNGWVPVGLLANVAI